MREPASAQGGAAALPASGTARRIAWAVLVLLPLLFYLGTPFLFDVDEGAFSEATREMFAHHDWLHTTLNGAARFDKPIGVYWLQALCVQLFGLNEFALRLPSALSCWGMALALGVFAGQRWGERAGALAGLMASTSIGYLVIGRTATADGLLNFLLVLSALDLWRFVETGTRAPLRRAYAWVGLGLLVKGPVAILVPGAAFGLWVITSRRWRVLRDALLDAPGWLLMIAIAAPWYAYALHRHGMAFVEGFLLHHNVERFTGTIGRHGGTVAYYLVMLPLLAMPWTPLMAVVVARARRLWAEPLPRFLLGWVAFVLVLFSFSNTKLPHYVLYGYAPLVLLMARVLAQAGRGVVRAVAAAMVAWAAIIAAVPGLVAHFAGTVRDPLYHALLSGAPAASWWQPAVAILAVLVLLFWRGAPWWRVPAAALATALLVGGWSLPWFSDALQSPIRRAAAIAAARPGPIVSWEVHWPTFSVYAGREVPKGDPKPQDMVLTRADRLPPGPARQRLFDERGVVLLAPLAP